MEERHLYPLTAEELLIALHEIIDKVFKRKDRTRFVNKTLLMSKMTLWRISIEFQDCDPSVVCTLLKELIELGCVITNMNEADVTPFDAYFIPRTEFYPDRA